MIAQNVAEIVRRHVKLTVEGIDRMYTPTLREAENSPLPNGATQILPSA